MENRNGINECLIRLNNDLKIVSKAVLNLQENIKEQDDPYNEKQFIKVWNRLHPNNKIKLANIDNKYCIIDAINYYGTGYEFKCINDFYIVGNYDTALLPCSKAGYSGNLIIIYKFFDGYYYIRYSRKFDDYQTFKLRDRNHFLIPKEHLRLLERI